MPGIGGRQRDAGPATRSIDGQGHRHTGAANISCRDSGGQNESGPAEAASPELHEKQLTIRYGDTGYSYESLFGAYLVGAKELVVSDPYIRHDHQLRNFIQVCELCVQIGTIKKITLITGLEHEYQKAEVEPKFKALADSLADTGVEFSWSFDDKIHDRELRTDTGWHVRIGRGLDIYQRTETWIQIGATNLDLRPCMETKVSIFREPK